MCSFANPKDCNIEFAFLKFGATLQAFTFVVSILR